MTTAVGRPRFWRPRGSLQYEFEKTIKLVGFNGEEEGLVGSSAVCVRDREPG
ncbi:MAG: hypothetical protein R3E12_04580 [Candidatus Eisenbacteria bacterium]